MALIEALAFDALLLVAAVILIYLTFKASHRLAARARHVSTTFLVVLRVVVIAEIVVLMYAIIDIPWNFVIYAFPGVAVAEVVKYIIVYAVVATIVMVPILSALWGVPAIELERGRTLLLKRKEQLLHEMRIITTKYLRGEVREDVFREVCKEIQSKLTSIEARLERLALEAPELRKLLRI